MSSLTQLEYLVAVDEERHFGKAAEKCHVSQPTLSQQIQKLEDELGIVVFDRIKKPIVPTPQGAIFLEQARQVLREHQKLVHLAQQKRGGEVAGEFRLGIIPTIASSLVPLFVQSFAEKYPKVELHIDEVKTETILQELEADRLDGAILATPLDGEHNFKIHPLYYEPFEVYLSTGHPLLKKSFLTQAELRSSRIWLLQDGHCFKNQIVNFCSIRPDDDAIMKNIHFQSGSLDTLRMLVAKNQGYTLLPSLMTHQLPKKEVDAHVRAFRAPIPTREVSFIYRRDHWKLEIISAIKATVLESLPKTMSQEKRKDQKVLDIA